MRLSIGKPAEIIEDRTSYTVPYVAMAGAHASPSA